MRPNTPAAFFKGLRLAGIDGTQWSLSNTPQINAATTKTRTRRGLAASDGLLSAATQAELIESVRTVIAAEALPKRRPRSCARKVR